jgi:hypothetical protein
MMMYSNPYLTHPLAKERVNDAVREAERTRLIREAKCAGMTTRVSLYALLARIPDRRLALISFGRVKSDALAPRGEQTA